MDDLLKKAAKLFLLELNGEFVLLVSTRLPELSLFLVNLENILFPPKECLILSNRPGFLLLQLLREAVLLQFSSRSSWDERLPNKGPIGSSSGAKRFAEIGLEVNIVGVLPKEDLFATVLVLMVGGVT